MISQENDRYYVRGAITMVTADAILIEGLEQFKGDSVLIDLSKVDELDSAAISVMLHWIRDAQSRSSKIKFVNIPANLLSLAVLYGVHDLIPNFQQSDSEMPRNAFA